MREKCQRGRREKAERDKLLTYDDIDWAQLEKDGKMNAQQVSVLDLYINKHRLIGPKRKITKAQKAELVSSHIDMSAALS